MKPLTELLGDNIKRIRKAHGFKSQEAFAEALGISRVAVARWESGQFKPSTKQIRNICRTLGIGEGDLFDLAPGLNSFARIQARDLEEARALIRQAHILLNGPEKLRLLPSPAEQDVLSAYRSSTKTQKSAILKILSQGLSTAKKA